MALCATTIYAEQVWWLKDNVKALMPYEDFPTVEEVIKVIPDDDPLANLKRTEVLHTLISLTDFYPIFEEGKWQDLAISYKRAFKKMGGQWPLSYNNKVRLEEVGFESYPFVMATYFPEAFKLKPSSDSSDKEEAAIRMVALIGVSLLALAFVALIIQKWRSWKRAKN